MSKAKQANDFTELAKRLDEERASTLADLNSAGQELDGVTADEEQEGGTPTNQPG